MKNISSLCYLLWNYSSQRDKQKPDSTHSNLGAGDPMRLRSQSKNWCLVVIRSRCRSFCRGVKEDSKVFQLWSGTEIRSSCVVAVVPSVFSILHFSLNSCQTSNFVFHTFSKFCGDPALPAECVEEFFGPSCGPSLDTSLDGFVVEMGSGKEIDPIERSIRLKSFFSGYLGQAEGTLSTHVWK